MTRIDQIRPSPAGDFRNATFNLGATNLFNQSYIPPASRLPAPGISFTANLAVDL